ncbi:glycosyltransferase family 2 protein [Patescibacteria group bacterium]|nr:glycosyltransferase family 2 protein [Patescibacteria group bacterium]MBU0963425.1 glycosyltransferase family 2 protein [Patescibacteria group bacterium]
MIKFSICIITYNEELNISRCLENIYDISDDIIIIDSYSTDKTVELAKKYKNVRIYKNCWPGYSKQRNLANSKAKYDWIFQLDIDEFIPDDLKEELKNIDSMAEFVGYNVPCLDFFYGRWIKHGDWYPQYHTRLYNKKILHMDGEILVHEKLIPHNNQKYKIGTLKSPHLHFSHITVNDTLEGFKKYTNLDSYERINKISSRSYWIIFIKMCVNMSKQFFGRYFIKKGLLDGWHGFYIACMMAWYEFMIHIKLFTLRYYQKNKHKINELGDEHNIDLSFYDKTKK